MKTNILLFSLLLCAIASAHTTSVKSGGSLFVPYAGSGTVTVDPVSGEGCIVRVEASEIVITTPLLAITLAPATGLQAIVKITAARHPVGGSETTVLQLAWAATGATASGQSDPDCTGRDSFTFTVNVTDIGALKTISRIAAPAVTPTDPVSLATGEYFFEEPADLDLGGPMRVLFSRYYATGLKSSAATPSPLGDNWSHNFLFYLTPPASGTVTVTDNRGRVISFQQSGTTFASGADNFAGYGLTPTSDGGYVMADKIEGRFYGFSPAGLLTSIQDRNGNRHAISYTGSGASARISSVSDGLGRSLAFAYDGNNRITSVTDGTRTVTFGYSGSNLTAMTDIRNNVTRYAYDTTNSNTALMVSKTLPRGNLQNSQTYDSAGRVVTQADGNRNSTRFTYNSGNTVQTDPAGRTQTWVFDSSFAVQSATDELGNKSTFTYDSTGRRTSVKDSLGFTSQFSYDAQSGLPATITEADGSTAQWTYIAQSQAGGVFRVPSKVTFSSGDSVSFAYDASGNITSMTDRAGKVTSLTYTSRGQALTTTNPAGGVITVTYNQDGTPATVTDAGGGTVTFTYDVVRRPASVTYGDGSVRRYTYDAADHLLTDTDGRGKTARFVYDENGNMISVADPLGNLTGYSYDAMDRLISVIDPLGAKVTRTYDTLGRVSARADRNGNAVTFTWDAASRLTGITDPSGATWRRDYDAEGFLLRSTDPLSNASSAVRDAMGRAVKVTGPGGGVYSTTWDKGDRVVSFTDPAGVTTAITSDARGDIASLSAGDGVASVGYSRGDLGQVTTVTDGNGQVWSKGYDARGRMVSLTDPQSGSTAFAYDSVNRLSSLQLPEKLGSLTLTRDGSGNLTRKSGSDGTVLDYTFDDAGILTAATGVTLSYNSAGDVISSNGINIQRDAGGRMTTMTLAPGKIVTYSYDQRDRVTKVADWAGGITTFTYDAAGRMTSMARPNGITATFIYNADGAVTSIQETGKSAVSTILVQRDGRGNVTAETRTLPASPAPDNGSFELSYDANSQVSGYAYDKLGRLTQDAGRTYSWDTVSRLTSYTDSTGPVTNGYDAFDLRTSSTRAGVTKNFVWNYALRLKSVSVVRQGSVDLRYYIHTPSGLLLYSVEATGSARRFYHFDESGNTAYLTDDSAAVTDSYTFTPFGTQLSRSGNTDNPFTFAGQQGAMQEPVPGLYYMRARYYDSSAARFISRDPAQPYGVATESGAFSYARANALLFSDPTGLDARIDNDGTHTDIAVDVWENGSIVGVLNVSFGEGGYRRRNSGGGGSCSSSGGVLLGGEGSFNVFFTPGTGIGGTSLKPTQTLVPGSSAQDEKVAQAMLGVVDFAAANKPAYQVGTPAGSFLKARYKELALTEQGTRRSQLAYNIVPGSGVWKTYGIFNGRTCKTFTGEMLNTYWGTDYGTGIQESSVREMLSQHK